MRRARFRALWSLDRLGGPLLTVAAVAVLALLSGTILRIPDPPAILVLTTVFATFCGGLRAGLASAAITWLYLAHFFSLPGQPLRYSDENLWRVVIWGVATPLMAFLVGIMKRRADRSSDEIVRREREHSATLTESLAERTRAEQSLRALFERNLAGMFRTRRDGRVLECNTAFVHLLGYRSREDVLAQNAREFYADPRDRERLLQLMQPGVVISNHEVRLRRADGTPAWVLINVREVVERGSTYLEGIAIDITDRKHAELGLRVGAGPRDP